MQQYNSLKKLKITKSLINLIPFSRSLRLALRKKANAKFIPPALNLFIQDLENKYPDYWIFSTFWPWGDFLMCCALLDEFKRQNGGKILILYAGDTQLQFINTFKFADETLKVCPEFYYALCTNKGFSEHNKHGLTKGHLYEMSHHVFKEVETLNVTNFFELYAKMFKLTDPIPETPVVPQIVKGKVEELYKNISEDKKVILITPDAHSYDSKEISIEFWTNLTSKLEDIGYKVIFNTKRKQFENFEKVFLPLFEESYFATLCHANITLRSGFTDIITIMGAKNQIVLYPKSMRFITITEEAQIEEINRCFKLRNDKTFEETMFDVSSINNMFKKNFLEIIVDDENKTIVTITKTLTKKEETEVWNK